MSKNIPNPDFIDAYLKHKLSEGERGTFERQLKKDPLLQNEVNLQHEIMAQLAEVRKAELKARLNSLTIDTPIPWYSLGSVKWTAAAITVFSLGLSYFYFFNEEKDALQPFVNLDEQVLVLERKAKINKPVPAKEFVNQDQISDASIVENENRSTLSKQKEVIPNLKTDLKERVVHSENKKVQLPEIVRPEIKTNFDDDFQTRDYDDMPVLNKGLAQIEEVTVPNIEIENEVNTGDQFQYRYADNRLYLYGDFKGIPYEILALNSLEETRLFLKYDNNFYSINSTQTEIIPLIPIENQNLINELKIVSNYK